MVSISYQFIIRRPEQMWEFIRTLMLSVASRGTLAIAITLWKVVVVCITWRNGELNSAMSNTFAFTFRRLGGLGAHTSSEKCLHQFRTSRPIPSHDTQDIKRLG